MIETSLKIPDKEDTKKSVKFFLEGNDVVISIHEQTNHGITDLVNEITISSYEWGLLKKFIEFTRDDRDCDE